MLNTHEVLRQRLLLRAGLGPAVKAKYRLEDLENSEWSPSFERLMRNRLIMGALRYGTLAVKKCKSHRWDLVGAVQRKIQSYETTGNTEYLVDAANYCLLEFECGNHPLKHFDALDDQDHCRVV